MLRFAPSKAVALLEPSCPSSSVQPELLSFGFHEGRLGVDLENISSRASTLSLPAAGLSPFWDLETLLSGRQRLPLGATGVFSCSCSCPVARADGLTCPGLGTGVGVSSRLPGPPGRPGGDGNGRRLPP